MVGKYFWVELPGPCRFFIETTVLPNRLIVYDGGQEVTVEPQGYQENTPDTLFVPLDDPRVSRWKREV